jgi:hypothetical protein
MYVFIVALWALVLVGPKTWAEEATRGEEPA